MAINETDSDLQDGILWLALTFLVGVGVGGAFIGFMLIVG